MLRLISCSPRGPGFLAPVARAMRKHRRQLDSSVGASGPHDFAVRVSAIRQGRYRRPLHPASRFVTIASRPSSRGGTAGDIQVICVSEKPKYFCKRGLTKRRGVKSETAPDGQITCAVLADVAQLFPLKLPDSIPLISSTERLGANDRVVGFHSPGCVNHRLAGDAVLIAPVSVQIPC